MNDKNIKHWLGYALRNKETILHLLDNFRPEDLENGLLSIPETLINDQLSPTILGAASPWISRYHLNFSNNMIFVDAELNAKQAGPVRAMLMLSVEEFTFRPDRHRISFQYREDIRSTGNPAQAMMLKMFGGGNGFLAKLTSMAGNKLPGITADGRILTIDIDHYLHATGSASRVAGALDHLTLRYVAAGDGYLKLQFTFM
ncbi:MAG: hypothetical protein IJM99_02315 [Firmicutes bacterium]|nr:hypothetical protein [Bacillota bacterium]